MTKGLIDDGAIESVLIEAPEISRESIPVEHRTRFFNERELETIAHLLQGKKYILEIGCQNGRTAKVILSNRPDIEMYVGVDVPPGTKLACDVQKTETPDRAGEFALDDERFVLMLTKNGSAMPGALCFPKVDAVFIDGDHSKDAVIRDHLVAKAITKPGGIIIHHDYHSLGTVGVREALLELQARGEKFNHVAGTWIVYQEVE